MSDEASNRNMQTGVLKRDHTTALVLAVFFGMIGANQFYLGKTGKGLLKLFTFGLFGILYVIDIIMIATRSVNNIVWKDKDASDWIKTHIGLDILIAIIVLFWGVAAIASIFSAGQPDTVTASNTATKSSSSNNTGSSTGSNSTGSSTTGSNTTAASTTPPTTVLLTQSGSGEAQTQPFTTKGEWTVSYTFDCSNFGQSGNFQFDVDNTDSSDNDDNGANDLATSGGNTDYYYDAGQHYLSINSECNWTVTVKG